MRYPYLTPIGTTTEWTQEFQGLDRRPRTYDGAFSAMGNMTGDPWPLLSARKKRGLVAALDDPKAMAALGKLAWIDGTTLYYDGEATAVNDLSTEENMLPKRMVCMGAYIVIFPDKKYYNTADPTDTGNIERLFSASTVSFTPCDMDGTEYPSGHYTAGSTAPANPQTGDYWLNTGELPHTLYRYYEDWVSVSSTYVRMEAAGIGAGLNAQDSVTLSGIQYAGQNETLESQYSQLNETHVVQAVGDNFIVVAGVIDQAYTQQGGPVRADRLLPNMDYVIECNNRLWGCRYGDQDGETVNRIYASALGDFKNWQKYMGTSQDSFYVNVGTDGPFTGAVAHQGYPYFFKADCVHKVFGEKPSNYQIQTAQCDGVRAGSADTLKSCNGMLYYLGVHGPQRFESLPEPIGEALGIETLKNGAAGVCGGKYYLCADGEDGQADLYVLDMARLTWHREDDAKVLSFAELNGELYMLFKNGLLYAVNGTAGEKEEDVTWYAETAEMGYEYPQNQYLSRFRLRMKLGKTAECAFSIQYDSDGVWHPKGAIRGTGTVKMYTLPIVPRRCEHCKIRIEGRGDAELYGIARELATGS